VHFVLIGRGDFLLACWVKAILNKLGNGCLIKCLQAYWASTRVMGLKQGWMHLGMNHSANSKISFDLK
jgi:hypothetical protein